MGKTKISDEKVYKTVASHIAELGWNGFMQICDDDSDEASKIAEMGWSGIYDTVSSKDPSDLLVDYYYLFDD